VDRTLELWDRRVFRGETYMAPAQPTLLVKVHGLCCADEAVLLKREVARVVGGEDRVSFDILNGTMAVQPGMVWVSADAVKQAVARTGMRAEVWQGDEQVSDRDRFWQRRGRAVVTAASGLFSLAGFLVHVWLAGGVQAALGSEAMGVAHEVPVAARVLYVLGIVAGAWYVVPKAWYAVRRLRPDMNLLMTVAVLGAAAIGEWFEAAVVSFLFAASLALESWSVGRARRAIAALIDLTPPAARVA
jgi:Cd2+/Zn2+-exporting ATPase